MSTICTFTANITNTVAEKLARQNRKDSAAECSTANASGGVSITVTDISDLLEQHRAAIATDFSSPFANLDTKLDKIQAVSRQGQCIIDLKFNAEEVSQRLEELEATCSSPRDNRWLKSKLSDLEGRSYSHCELTRVHRGHTTYCLLLPALLVDVFGGQVLQSPPELNRTHHSLALKPGPGDRPRPVIIRFHSYRMKDLVMREACKRADLEYCGHKVRFYED